MLRKSVTRLISVARTSVPNHFVFGIDMAFYYPRFQPVSHVQTMGIPELNDAVALLQPVVKPASSSSSSLINESVVQEEETMDGVTPAPPRWSTSSAHQLALETPEQRQTRLANREKALVLLDRGIDILESLGGVTAANSSIASMIRPLYATRFELLNGCEHLPRPEYARHLHVHKTILNQSAKLLYYDACWERTDLAQLDVSCVVMAHFIRAFCALHQKPFHDDPPSSSSSSSSSSGGGAKPSFSTKSVKKSAGGASASESTPPKSTSPSAPLPKEWTLCVGGSEHPDHVLTLQMVMDKLQELIQLSDKACSAHGATHPEMRWTTPKLMLLKSLLTIPLTGNLSVAQHCASLATERVRSFTERQRTIMDSWKGLRLEPELPLYTLVQTEIAARAFDWRSVRPGEVDGVMLEQFDSCASWYVARFETPIDPDGIMSEKDAPERAFELQAYMACLLSKANFLLNAPRPPGSTMRDTPVFLPRQTFSMNPLLSVGTSSNIIFTDIQDRAKLSIERCRRLTGEALERALRLNRALFPEAKLNPQAAWTLLSMACMYADTRDYLYATGLFETAKKSMTEQYGPDSLEEVLLQKLRYEFLAGVGSDQEAKTASHEVIALLKRLDGLPSQ